MAAELVGLPVNVIFAGAEPSVLAAKAATSTIPIVFAVGSDPVRMGLVTSYNSPGGNATGVNIFTTNLDVKRLGLLHDLIPSAKSLGILINSKFPYVQDQLSNLQAAVDAARTKSQSPATAAAAHPRRMAMPLHCQ
jgi:putative ABC transport system substrate-binding protein